MLLDVIVIDDCNGFLFVTPLEGENQRSGEEAFEMDGYNDRDSATGQEFISSYSWFLTT